MNPFSKEPLSSLNALLDAQMRDIPVHFLARFLSEKLSEAGVKSDVLAEAFARHIISGSKEKFVWCDIPTSEDHAIIEIPITSDEENLLIERLEKFMKDDLSLLIQNMSLDIAVLLTDALKSDWLAQDEHESSQMDEFCSNLEKRWGDAMARLRMLRTIAREIGEHVIEKKNRSGKQCGDLTGDVLTRLHARACQVTSEIIILMESGYADGAMARWRTLHEILVVGILIKEHGEPLVVRYLAHEAVEAKHEMDRYVACHAALGYKPPRQEEIKKVERAYAAAIATYGSSFGNQYGWAAHHLGVRKPTFVQLEVAAGRAAMRAHYQLASHNVHAGSRGLSLRLGLLGNSDILLAGASNAGLVEPGQNTAHDLVQMTALLFGEPWQFDEIIMMRIILIIREEISPLFANADRRLRRDYSREIKK